LLHGTGGDAKQLDNVTVSVLLHHSSSTRPLSAGLSAEVGVVEGTVCNRTAAQNGKPSVSTQPIEADPDDPRQVGMGEVWAMPETEACATEPTAAEMVRADLAEMERPEVGEWHRALEALRGVKPPAAGVRQGGLKCGA
jgi:hypothetical protein